MGQAKQRGTFEERQAAAIERDRLLAEQELRRRINRAIPPRSGLIPLLCLGAALGATRTFSGPPRVR